MTEICGSCREWYQEGDAHRCNKCERCNEDATHSFLSLFDGAFTIEHGPSKVCTLHLVEFCREDLADAEASVIKAAEALNMAKELHTCNCKRLEAIAASAAETLAVWRTAEQGAARNIKSLHVTSVSIDETGAHIEGVETKREGGE